MLEAYRFYEDFRYLNIQQSTLMKCVLWNFFILHIHVDYRYVVYTAELPETIHSSAIKGNFVMRL